MSNEIDFETLLDIRAAFRAGNWFQAVRALDAFLKERRFVDEVAQVDWARRVIEKRCAWWRDRVTDETAKAWAAGEFATKDAVYEFAIKRSHDCLTDSKDARAYLLVSSNANAAAIHDVNVVGEHSFAWSIMAATALAHDVVIALVDHNITADIEPPKTPSSFCECCGRWHPHDEWDIGKHFCNACTKVLSEEDHDDD